MATQEDKEKLAFELIKERLSQQIDSVRSLDLKASIVLAMIGVIFTGYIQRIEPDIESLWVRGVTFLLLILAGLFAVLTFVQRRTKTGLDDWRNDPEPKKLFDMISDPKYKVYKYSEVGEHIMSSMVESYESNKRLYKKRYDYLYRALFFLLIAIIIIGVQATFHQGGSTWQAKQPNRENHHYRR